MSKGPAYELIDRLDLPEERVRELLDDIFRVAAKWIRSNRELLAADRAKELLALAKSKEEAYLIGMVADMIQNDLKLLENPFAALERVEIAMKTLEVLKRFAEEGETDGGAGEDYC